MPSIINGLFAGRSGIQGHGSAISVLADNISNSNTVGYKPTRPEFSDLLAGNLGGGGGGGITVGSGSSLTGTTQIFSQGTFEFTGRALDLAIDGTGFFITEDTLGQRLYSRAGNFSVDSDGNLLNQNGNSVLGFPEGGTGGLERINVNDRTSSDVFTRNVDITGNLDASTPVLTNGATDIPDDVSTNNTVTTTYTDLNNAAEFSTFVDVFDSLGASHTVSIFFFHTASGATNEWVARAYVPEEDILPTTSPPGPIVGTGQPYQIGSVTMEFSSDGQRINVTDPDFTATESWANGSSPMNIEFSLDPFTQFANPSSINSISQDGSGGGQIISFSVGSSGQLFALLDNGQQSEIGTLAVANFSNLEGLGRRSGSLWVETVTSGEPVVGTPNTGQFGAIQSEALELSAADLAADFIKLISLQRGFQGSSRVIGSIDELLNEIVNLA